MKRFFLGFLFVLAFTGAALAALHFPALTGRVVDDAQILSLSAKESLEQTLAEFEQQTSDQLVVVTLRSLEGDSIEDYGYQLGRAWGIGQKDKNNGALLIVAPKEHKVRIEVGYGLEPVLTDAVSKIIIEDEILPAFRAGHMEQGVIDGTTAIMGTISGKPVVMHHAGQSHAAAGHYDNATFWIILVVFIIFRLFVLPWWFPMFLPSHRGYGGYGGSGFSGGGFSGGGFSGGGGSFGGGGASGGW